jgi:hypothetical protein
LEDAGEDGGTGVGGGGAELEDVEAVVDAGYAVGEGASGVDGDAQATPSCESLRGRMLEL